MAEILDLLREEALLEPFTELYRRARGRKWFAPAPITVKELKDFDRLVEIGLFLVDRRATEVKVNQQTKQLRKNEIVAELTPLGSAVGDAALET